MKKFFFVVLVSIILVSGFGYRLHADTSYKAYGENGVTLHSGVFSDPSIMIDDGYGNYIVVFVDRRTDSGDIYAQKYNSSGVAQWTTNGVAISAATGVQNNAVLTSDGSGGAIIAWQDARTDAGDIYAQRIDSTGTVQWTTDGIVIANPANTQNVANIVSDGSNGAIIAWNDGRSGTNDIYAQRVDSSGAVQWAANGVVVTGATGGQSMATLVKNTSMITDGSGGAMIVWQDSRSGSDIYAQRIDSSGASLWTADGVVISNATNTQSTPSIKSDYAGGAIIAWQDSRTDSGDIYAERIDSSGNSLWTANGIPIGAATGIQSSSTLDTDTLGNAYVTWGDLRSGSARTYIQKVNTSGTVQWTTNGVQTSFDTTIAQTPFGIAADGSGGAVVGMGTSAKGCITQHLNSSGVEIWPATGIIIFSDTSVTGARYVMRDSDGNYGFLAARFTGSFFGQVQRLVDLNRDTVTNFSDQLDRINESVVSSHVIKYVSAYTVNAHEQISITFPVDFTFGASYSFADMQLSVGSTSDCSTATFSNKTIAASASGTTWGATYASNTVTFISDTDTIVANVCVRITLSNNGAGHDITNPTVASDTVYNLNIQNGRQQGQSAIIILNDAGTPDSDQIEIDALVITSISLDLDTVNTDCNNSTETGLNTVDLGLLPIGSVIKSSTNVNFICIDAATNAGAGMQIFVRDNRSNTIGGLVSGANSIDSATADLNSGAVTSGYGLRVSSLGTPSIGTFTAVSPFGSGTAGDVGQIPGILSSAAQIIDSSAIVKTGASSRIGVEVAAKAGSSTLPGAYSDIITFTALVNF